MGSFLTQIAENVDCAILKKGLNPTFINVHVCIEIKNRGDTQAANEGRL